MITLYIFSPDVASGKTALAAGIGKKLKDLGKRVGFFKPLHLARPGNSDSDRDSVFMKDILGLEEPLAELCPFSISEKDLGQSLKESEKNLRPRLRQAFEKITQGKDIVIIEGLNLPDADEMSIKINYEIIKSLDTWVLLLLRYSPDLSPSGIALINEIKQNLLGVIINFTPKLKIKAVHKVMKELFEKSGINIIGALPENRTLMGLSVLELAERLDGEVFYYPKNLAPIIENFMVGAMPLDPATGYFNRRANKAVIVRGERADMQLAALETPTCCLVLTGGIKPAPIVLAQAEDKEVPLIIVKQNTLTALADIEQALNKTRFHNKEKLQKLIETMNQYLDFTPLLQKLGLGN